MAWISEAPFFIEMLGEGVDIMPDENKFKKETKQTQMIFWNGEQKTLDWFLNELGLKEETPIKKEQSD